MIEREREIRDELVITRVFEAPRELVFKAWTDCEYLRRWWGPQGFTLPFCTIDLRQGGTAHYCMRSPEGRDYCGKGVYSEVVEPERIAYTDSFVDENGNPVPASYYGLNPVWPDETKVTVTFERQDRKTKLTLRHAIGSVPDSERDMCRQGWSQSLDKLAQDLAKTCSTLGVC